MAFTYRIRRRLGHLFKAERRWIVVKTRTWSNHQNIATVNDHGRTITRRNKHSHYGPQKLQMKDLRFHQDYATKIKHIFYDKIDYLLYYCSKKKSQILDLKFLDFLKYEDDCCKRKK